MHLVQQFLFDLHTDLALQLLVVILPVLIGAKALLEAVNDIREGYFYWSQLGKALHGDIIKFVGIAALALVATLSGVNPLLAIDGEKVALVTLGLGIVTELAQEAQRLTGLPLAVWQNWFDALAEKIHLRDANATQPSGNAVVSSGTVSPSAVQSVPDATPVG